MSYLLISIPFLLITGPFLPDLALITICIIYLFNNFFSDIRKYYKNYFVILFLIFYVFCILSSLFSDYSSISITRSIGYIRFLIFTLAVIYILNSNPKVVKGLFYSILVCFLILILDGFFQFYFKENIFGFVMQQNRTSSFFKDELIYGSYLSKFLPILLSLFFLIKKKNNKLNIIFSIIFILSVFAITISGERSSLFLTILILLYLMMMLKLNFKILSIFFVTIFLGVGLLVTLNETVKNRIIIFTKNQIFSENKTYFFSEDHNGHLLSALDIFKQNNKIIGIGPKNYRNYCFNNEKYNNKPYVCSSHPHNTYIQILLETGILGFTILIFIFFLIIYLSLRHFFLKLIKRKYLLSNFQVCLLSFYFMIFWPLVPTGSFFNNYLSIIYYIPFGLLIWSKIRFKSS